MHKFLTNAAIALGLFAAVFLSISPHFAQASRDSSGNYSLPAGNPVVTGTSISSTVHNATNSDIASELTDSLSRSGKGAMSAALKAYAGTVAAPGLTFDSATDNGLYLIGTDNIGMSINGVKTADYATTGVTLPLSLTVSNSATGNPLTVTAIGGGDAIDAINATADAGGNGVIGQGGNNGTGILGRGDSAATDATGVRGTGKGTKPGGDFTGGATGVGAIFTGGGSNARAPIRITTGSAPGTAVIGDLYVDSAGILYICTNATGPVWTKVGAQ